MNAFKTGLDVYDAWFLLCFDINTTHFLSSKHLKYGVKVKHFSRYDPFSGVRLIGQFRRSDWNPGRHTEHFKMSQWKHWIFTQTKIKLLQPLYNTNMLSSPDTIISLHRRLSSWKNFKCTHGGKTFLFLNWKSDLTHC